MVLTSGVTPLRQHVAADVAPAVLKNESADGAKAAKVEQVQACRAEEAGRVRLAERAAKGGKIIQRVADRHVARFEKFRAADRGHRKS